ncbi:PadR family transcriptional regulator [Polymorphospora rubra]|uniref:Transcription regulator PadR N-terminal domain-containing protein n=1 Tax=Polymorphospora rubra TaxID=338584 RepID=A0A810N096_9ACTN|nr:PadR family transcriptional regulator [Polymorphospora rubra]BCJ65068.1 hypothetical protein Prubr_20890 [Polymorphospora rubra]
MPPDELKLTMTVGAVVREFLMDPQVPRYGFDLMRATHLPSGTLYPILARLQRAGWVTSHQEDIDPSVAGRPARRFYKITAHGAENARLQLAELSERLRPPAGGRLRPSLEGKWA